MTKEQLIEQVSEYIIKLDKNADLHPEIVAKHITAAIRQILYSTFRKVPTELDLMSKKFTLNIVNNESTLPCSIYQLPDMAAIRRVSLTEDDLDVEQHLFTPREVSMAAVYGLLDVAKVDTSSKYYVSEKSIKWSRLPDGISAVDVWLIPTFDTMEDEDEVYIPSGKDIDFFDVLRTILSGTAKENLLNR